MLCKQRPLPAPVPNGPRSYLVRYFQQALNGSGLVVATNCIAETTGMLAADISEVVPPGHDPAFIDALLDVCRHHKIKLLCSLHDWEAPYISDQKDRFTEIGVIPVIAEPDIIDVCLDKYKTWLFAKEYSIPFLESYINLDLVEHDLKSGVISFPLILKPRLGHASIGLKKVWNKQQLLNAYEYLVQELENQEFNCLAENNTHHPIIVQPFSNGQEYGVDIVNDIKGNFAACFVKHKLAMRSGETDAAETVSFPQIESVARKLSSATRCPGNMDADFLVTNNGKIFLLEMNSRFGGGYPFSHEAGADVPAALIAWAKGEKPDPNWLKIKPEVRCFKEIAMLRA